MRQIAGVELFALGNGRSARCEEKVQPVERPGVWEAMQRSGIRMRWQRSWLLSPSLAAALAGLWLQASPAQAGVAPDPWQETFVPSATAGSLAMTDARIVVAVAGSSYPELDDAVVAMVDALEASKRVQQVHRDPRVHATPDAAIVKLHAGTPHDRLMIVRGFEAEHQVVVTIYDASGELVDAFSATPGTPIESDRASAGVGVVAGRAVASAVDGSTESAQEANEEYDRNYVHFEENVVASVSGSTVLLGRSLSPVRGKYNRPLEGDAFYRHLGRDDLAAQYQANATKRKVMIGTGIGLFVGGAAMMGSSAFFLVGDNRNPTAAWTLLGVGGATLVGGSWVWTAGAKRSLHPISASEARELADEYNRELEERLKLSERADPSKERRASIGVAPSVSRQGAGIVLGGSF